nr:transposase [Paenibacillus piri]
MRTFGSRLNFNPHIHMVVTLGHESKWRVEEV